MTRYRVLFVLLLGVNGALLVRGVDAVYTSTNGLGRFFGVLMTLGWMVPATFIVWAMWWLCVRTFCRKRDDHPTD